MNNLPLTAHSTHECSPFDCPMYNEIPSVHGHYNVMLICITYHVAMLLRGGHFPHNQMTAVALAE
jgi:hypothetical protein